MNFSRKGTSEKAHDIKSTKKRLVTKSGVSIFRIIIVSLIAIIIVGGVTAFATIKAIIDRAPDIGDIGLTPTGYKTTIYDIDGEIMDTLIGAESNRIYVKIESIPEVLQHAFVAIEDERFYEHNGVDVKGIFRAFFQGLAKFNFDQGASTITQQLIKNQVFNGGNESNSIKKFERKIQEQYLAIKLERLGDKAEIKKNILERYLNTINCGQGTYGVQTASNRYFNKDVSELNLSESAVIAVITNYPVLYNPITNPADNQKRRQLCLDKMLELGYCTQEEYNEAIADTDDVYKRIQAVNEEYDESGYNSYFVDALIDQLINDLTEIGYTQAEASNLLYTGGLNIYSTQDTQIQNIVDDVYSNKEYFPTLGSDAYYELKYALSIQYPDGSTIHYQTNDLVNYFKHDPSFSTLFVDKEKMEKKIAEFKKSVYNKDAGDILLGEKATMTIQPQSSFVVINQHTGYVSALIGGLGDKDGNRTLNRATSTKRQPGSTFKILSTYLPALDTAGLTLATTFNDEKYYYPGTNTEVKNYDTSSYRGLTTMRYAIAQSMNIIAVKTLEVVTPQVGYDYLLKLGITTLSDGSDGSGYTDISYPLALGGITSGVTNLELTAAYAAIANSGTYQAPTLYTKVIDHNGNVLIDKSKSNSVQVMKESTAWLLTDAMKDVVTSGTGTLCRFRSIRMPVAGKTGTTSKNLDTWFVGYTPYYTAGIWSGYDNNNLSQTNRSYHKNVWREIMERIHKSKGLKTVDFERPNSVKSVKICTKSGKLAVDGLCDKALGGPTVKSEYFASGTEPTETCDVHIKVSICKESGEVATKFCPLDQVEEIVFLNPETATTTTNDSKYIMPSKKCEIHDAFYNDYEDEKEDEKDDFIIPGNEDDPIIPPKPDDLPIPTPDIDIPNTNEPEQNNPEPTPPIQDELPDEDIDSTE